MNILLVDDEQSAIQALLKEIDWAQFGFERILTANSAAKAREILGKEPVELLLCDIEMPVESGLELLEWIQREQISTECIFLTCYADFSYAQKALSLGSIDYCLKPIHREEIERSLWKAIGRRRETDSLMTESRAFQKNKAVLYGQFFTDFFSGYIVPEREAIQEALAERTLELNMDSLYLPIYIVPRVFDAAVRSEEKSRTVRRLHDFLKEGLQKTGYFFYDIKQSDHTLMVILEVKPEQESRVRKNAEQLCREFLIQAETLKGAVNYCYVGNPLKLTELPEQVEQLHTMDLRNSQQDEQLRFLCFYRSETDKQLEEAEWGQLTDAPVAMAKAYIRTHIREEILVPSIAREVHLNHCYLTRIFKKKTGKSLNQYILELKMEIARDELVNSGKNMGEIATGLGYLNYASFSRAFTNKVGMSPMEYRKQTAERSGE